MSKDPLPTAPTSSTLLPAHGREREVVHGWGRRGVIAREDFSSNLAEKANGYHLSRGLGRSYGDSSLPCADDGRVLNTTLCDRILGFNEKTGILHAEAGLSLATLKELFMPRGWFTPVTPGTQFVTLGGMVASDVHGKNHHVAGCFGQHVRQLTLMVADGSIVRCSPEDNAELFWATIGGMGLTGHILEVRFQMERIPSQWIYQESERIPDIDRFVRALRESAQEWPMTVGWIDCVSRGKNMGRGLLMKGRWATETEAPPSPPRSKSRVTMPSFFPGWALNPLTIRAFNTLYYHKHIPREKKGIVHPDAFFYPLDMIRQWNRMYGRQGFTQYQCVLPVGEDVSVVRNFLDLLTAQGGASFLCVIKDCGPEGQGMLSFPHEGISIALDIAVTTKIQALIDSLNRFVIAAGGRIYLTKDTYTRAEDYWAMDPRLGNFLTVCRKWDPEGTFRSAQSVRLFHGFQESSKA